MLSEQPVISPCVLLVQTDPNLTSKVSVDLKEAGYYPAIATNTTQALSEAEMLQPAMVVLDKTVAGEKGIKFCRRLRNLGNRMPILMLVDRETVEERVACLEAGADDYFLKPYRSEIFLELVGFYLQPEESQKEQLRFGDLALDLVTRRLFLNEQAIDLTMKEFELLKYLMSHPREVLSRERILENVWGYNFQGESNVIEVYIRYLRLKMEHEGRKRLIHTIRGVGYVLKDA